MSCKLRNTVALLALSLAVVWCIPAFGQVVKGSISGTVTDPQGAVVSGATVKATQQDTGASFKATSDSSGSFRFNLIPTGPYKVEATAQGFKTSVENGVLVSAGADSGIGLKLAVGESSVVLDVSGDAAPLIETTQSQVTNTFSGEALHTFAGLQENEGLDSLALFVPGVVNTRDNNFSNTNGPGFSTNGQRGRNNDQQIDGQNNNDNSVGGPGLFVSDAEFVGQYVIVTNQFGPEYGRNGGSVVNIITKGGGNVWHGSIYENENNSIFNSLTNDQKRFEGLTQVPRLNDEFGGFTIGGPIVKNKAQIFGGFNQEIISTLTPFHTDGLTPTPAGLATLNGCFPGSVSLQQFNRFGPYSISAGNPTSTVDPTTLAFTPQTIISNGVTCPNVQFGGLSRTLSTPNHAFNFVLKNDIQLGNDSLSSRYLFNRGNAFNADLGDAVNGYPINIPALSQAILESWTHNFTSHMVNEARVSFGRLNVQFGGNNIGNTVPTQNNVGNAIAQASIQAPGFDRLFGAGTGFPQGRIVNTWQGQDNWNYVHGKHQLKAGVSFTYQRSPNTFLPNLNGSFRFSNWGDTGSGCTTHTTPCATGFISNTPNLVSIANGVPSLDFREHDTFIYAGDDWKISQNLTLNLGITWTYYGQPENLFNTLTTARESNPATAFFANTSSVTTTGQAASQFNGQAIPLSARTLPQIPAIYNSFGPSIGFAYSPQWGGFLTGHGKTVIRGGYRLLYDPPFYNIYLNESTATPNTFLQSFQNAAASTKGLNAGGPAGPNVRASLAPFLQKGVFDPRQFAETNVTPNFSPDRVDSWSLGLERTVTKNSAFEARYVGNRSTNLFQTLDGNPQIGTDRFGTPGLQQLFPNLVPAGLTGCPAAQAIVLNAIGRANCNEGVLRTRSNTGFSNYHALQTELRANNLFNQLTIRAGYTYSKTLDNVSEIFSTFGGGNTLIAAQNPANQVNGAGEYSFSGLHIPNVFTVAFTEQIPFFKEQKGAVGHVLGGWAVSANYQLASGQRYTPSQVFSASFTDSVNSTGNFYDSGYFGTFNGGLETARPFLGSASAPVTSVGMFAADACLIFSLTGTDPLCTGNPTQLVSLTAVGRSGCETDPNKPCPFVPVTKANVRYIVNSFTAQQVFGTPFGDTPRNPVNDAITNIANVSVFKRFKITERSSFEFRMSMLNAFNHTVFTSVDPFLEDAGLTQQGTGFGDNSLTNSFQQTGSNGSNRTVRFGGTFRF
ncbi:MAG TPA: carboxypeptidase regulatory-like domain-containing protein [Candidatus Angelobacter sp.]|nr:carboxypeptidase regulatory-like domain-containing protein [Candidatus Angelobacter sp.]